MDTAELQRSVRCGFNEILAGFTPFRFEGGHLYIKHFASRDQIEIDAIYTLEFERLVSRGVPTSEEKASQLKDNELWTEADDKALDDLQLEIENLKRAKRFLYLKHQIEEKQAEVDKSEKAYYLKLVEKNTLFGKTAELFANKKVSDHCIVHSVFRDQDCSVPFFGSANLDDLDDDELNKVTSGYNEATQKFDELNLKRIALSHLFQNYYHLAKSTYEFYGRAITSLTFYQVQLVSFGEHYKNLLANSETPPPSDVSTDPEKLDEWFNGSAHARKMLENTIGSTTDGEGSSFTAIVGASKEDLDYLGIKQEDNAVSLTEKVQEAGGFMSMRDLMILQGIK